MKPSIGRIVHYVLPIGRPGVVGSHRPAVVISPCLERFPGSAYQRNECQLGVFIDGTNDFEDFRGPLWQTSVPQDEEAKAPGTWHWPERE